MLTHRVVEWPLLGGNVKWQREKERKKEREREYIPLIFKNGPFGAAVQCYNIGRCYGDKQQQQQS